MKKGIIMEMDDSYLTLLTPDGEFCRAHKQDIPYSVGEEIHFFPITEQQKNRLETFIRKIKLKSVWMSTALILVFLGTVVPVYQSNRAYAYVSIDVNPSIELGLNKDMKVVELTGYNKEGENIVSQISDWKKRDVSEITRLILTELKNEGFVKDEPIIISTVRTEELAEKVEQKLEKNIKAIKQTVSNQQLEVKMVTTTEAELEKAHELGVTAGKYQEVKMDLTNKKHNQVKDKNKHKYTNKEKNLNDNEYTNKNQDKVKDSNINKIPPGQLKKQDELNIKNNNQSLIKENKKDKGNKATGQQKKINKDGKKEKPNEYGKDNRNDHDNDKRKDKNREIKQYHQKEKNSKNNRKSTDKQHHEKNN